MARLPPTERLHPDGARLAGRSLGRDLLLLHRGDAEAVRAVRRALPSLARLAALAAQRLAAGGRLVYAGAGTSGRLGALDAAECPPTFGVRPGRVRALLAGGRRALDAAVEGAEDDRGSARSAVRRAHLGRGDLLVGISASGTTPFTLAAIAEARRRGAATALLTCGPTRPATASLVVRLDTGPERVAGSTRMKAGSATKMALTLLSTGAMLAWGRVERGRMVGLVARSRKLRERAVRTAADLAATTPGRARAALARSGWRLGPALRILRAPHPPR